MNRFMRQTKFLFLSLLCLSVPLAAIAQWGEYDDFSYITNGSTLAIIDYDGPYNIVTIPSSIVGVPVTQVVSIGSSDVTYVTVPSTITAIGSQAFDQAASLLAIEVDPGNPSYTSLGGVLFDKSEGNLLQYPCGLSGTYTIPGSVTNIADYAFSGCSTLYGVANNTALVTIGINAFADCVQLASFALPATMRSIGDSAFFGSGLTSVSVPAGVTNIGGGAFGSTAITSITVDPSSPYFSSVGGVLFDKAGTTLLEYPAGNGVKSYAISNRVTAIGYDAFYACSGLTNVTIPDSVTNIADYAFYDCTRLINITIPGSMANIGASAFSWCLGLTQLTLEPGVASITGYAFSGCPSLTAVTIPGSVSYIGYQAFAFDSALSYVCFQSTPPAFCSPDTFDSDASLTVINYVAGTPGWGTNFANVPTSPCSECARLAPARPVIGSSSASGRNLHLICHDGVGGGTYYVLMATNIDIPMEKWMPVATNILSSSGDFTIIVSNTIAPNISPRFYVLQTK